MKLRVNLWSTHQCIKPRCKPNFFCKAIQVNTWHKNAHVQYYFWLVQGHGHYYQLNTPTEKIKWNLRKLFLGPWKIMWFSYPCLCSFTPSRICQGLRILYWKWLKQQIFILWFCDVVASPSDNFVQKMI